MRVGRALFCRVNGPGLLLGMLVAALGCGAPGVTERLEDFHGQVLEALGAAQPRDAYVANGRLLPRVRERRIEVGEDRVGPLTFLSLQGCRLGELAGYRNSPLGRVMVGTRRLAYEAEVLQVGRPCVEDLDDEEDRAELLALLDRKRTELATHVWNAVWTDSPLDAYLGSEETPRASAWNTYGLDALVEVNSAVVSVGSPEDALRLEEALGALRSSAPAGGLLRAMDRVRHELDGLAAVLEEQAVSGCDAQARRAAGIFTSSYPSLQAELAQLDRTALAALDQLGRLYASTAAGVEPPPAMETYAAAQLDLESADALFGRYRSAVTRHARAWSPLLEACGALPGA